MKYIYLADISSIDFNLKKRNRKNIGGGRGIVIFFFYNKSAFT